MRYRLIILAALSACGDDGGGTSTPVCPAACVAPPAPECFDGATLRSYASPGTCGDGGLCVYGHVDFACENGCDAGACLGVVDPCADVVCNTPPAARCDGEALETFASLGTCAGGSCSYASVALPCALGCEDGGCVGDPCVGVVCNAPPTPCHAAAGTCSSGVCSYAVLVGAACDDGAACSEDDRCGAAGTCAGSAIACQSPPAAVCAGDTLNVSAQTGACDGGQCQYALTEVPCVGGCSAGACNGDPCEGIVCDDPPSACYAASGTCENGVCGYAFENGAACDDGDDCSDDDRCTNGVCAGAERACTTPEPAVCKDAETLIARATAGTCDGGACEYIAIEVPCAFGCVEAEGVGGCEGDPCAGVVCTTPEPASCANPTSLVVPAATGICTSGACSYDTVVFGCAHDCQPGSGGGAAFCKPPEGLAISELMVDSAGFPDTDSFIEIHGPPGTDLAGVSIVGINGNGGADYATIALTGALDSQGLFVVAHPEALPFIADVADVENDDVDFQNGPDNVQLRFGAIILDALAYGDFDANDIARGEGAPHPVAPVGQSLARDGDYADRDDNLADFTAGLPTPAAPNVAPEDPPVADLDCPAGGEVDELLTFDASASTGDVATFDFDFGDGSGESGAATASHAYDTAGEYTVTVLVASAGGLEDEASCVVVIEDPPVETPFEYDGAEQCFGDGATYKYDVVSNPVLATTDGRLTVRYKGTSPYGPAPYAIELQTGADTWVEVAVTNDSKVTFQTQRFRVSQATLQAAIDAMGWVRFRHGSMYSVAADCMELDFVYNCESCFACPAGQEDLGIGCMPTDAPYDYTALEHSVGHCGASSYSELYLPGTPPAGGDGTLSIEFLGCGGTSIRVEMFTANSDWVDIGNGSAASCTFGSASWSIPEAYLDAAVSAGHAIQFRWDIDDNCIAGTGCEFYNDPCVKNAHLTYPR